MGVTVEGDIVRSGVPTVLKGGARDDLMVGGGIVSLLGRVETGKGIIYSPSVQTAGSAVFVLNTAKSVRSVG